MVVTGARMGDDQGDLKADAASFDPGSTTTARCSFDGDNCGLYVLSLIKPHGIQLGQRIVLKNAIAGSPGDLDVLVRDLCDGTQGDPLCDGGGSHPSADKTWLDEIVVETTAAATLTEDGFAGADSNLTALTGTFSTGTNCGAGLAATDLCGVAGGAAEDLDGQILGPTWIKASGAYRKVIWVEGNSTGKIESGFPALLNGASVQKLEIDVDTNPTQVNSARTESAFTGQLVLNSPQMTGNVTNGVSMATGTEDQVTVHGAFPSGGSTKAATATVTPYAEQDDLELTGTTDVSNITLSPAGRLLRVTVSGTAALLDSPPGAGNLRLASNFYGGEADNLITLVSTGSAWREVTRSMNGEGITESYVPFPDGILEGSTSYIMSVLSPQPGDAIEHASYPFLFGFDPGHPWTASGLNGSTTFLAGPGKGVGVELKPSTSATNHQGIQIVDVPQLLGIEDNGGFTMAVRLYKADADKGAFAFGFTGQDNAETDKVLNGSSVPTTEGGGVYLYTDFNSAGVKAGCSSSGGAHTNLSGSALTTLADFTFVTLAFHYRATHSGAGNEDGTVNVYAKVGAGKPVKIGGPYVTSNCGVSIAGFAPFVAVTRDTTAGGHQTNIRAVEVRAAGAGL
jgi:hypothetical protein